MRRLARSAVELHGAPLRGTLQARSWLWPRLSDVGGLLTLSSQVEGLPPPGNEKHGFFRGRRAKPVAGQNPNGTGNKGYDGEEDVLTTMGKIYNKIYSFSIITRYMLYVVPVGLLIAIPIIVGAIIGGRNHPPAIGGVPIVWFFSWIEIIWCSLWVSKIVAHFLPYVFQLFVGVVSSGKDFELEASSD